nr:hypothetical protein [Tanacetum cinerariifolium]
MTDVPWCRGSFLADLFDLNPKNGDQPLPVIAQVSLAGNAQNAPPTLKDLKFWTAEQKKTRKIDRLARSLLIQGLPNDIYSLIDSNETAKDLCDALERSVVTRKIIQNQGDVNDALGYKKKAVVITSDPLALVAEKMNKITALLAKAFNRRKFYSKPTNNNLRTSSTSQSANKKQEFVKSDDKKVKKKDDEKKRDLRKVKCYNCKKEGHFSKDCKKVKVKDYNYYKTKMLLTKKDSDGQVLLAEDQAWMESNESSSSAKETIAEVAYYTSESESESEFKTSEYYDNYTNYGFFENNDHDQEIFHDAIKSASENFIEKPIDSQKDYDKYKVDHNDSEEKEHLVDKLIRKFNHRIAKCQKRIEKANQQSKDFENQNKELQEKYDVFINQVNTFEEQNNEFNEQIKVLNEKNADLLDQTKVLKDQLQVKHVVIDTHVECHEKFAKLKEERYEYMIRYSALFDNDKQHRKKIADQDVLFDKTSVELVELDKHVRELKNTILEKDFKISELEEYNLYNGRKGIGFENPSYFEKAKDLRPTLYDEKVIGLGYTLMFLTHSDEALEIEKFKRDRENKIKFAYDYENLNASYQTSSLKPYVPNVILEKIIIDLEDEVMSLLEKEKTNLKTIEPLKSKGFESSENEISESENQCENDCHVVEIECDKVKNPKVIAPGMFKLSVSQSVSPISMSKSSCDYKNVESKLKRKRRKRKSSKQNDKQVNNDVSRASRDFVHFLDLDTFSSVRRPKHSGVIWKKKGSSNTSNVDLYSVSRLKLNKNAKRYSRKDLLSCNNSHLGETSGAYVCNDAMNVSCNSSMCDLFDDNNFFIFDDESIRISPVSKMPFKKKPRDSMNVRSKTNSNKSLPRTVHKWLPKMQPLDEPVAKWFPRIVQISLWIIDSGCSKHMTGNHALLTNFVEKFLGTVRFGNNDFTMIAS